MELLEKLAALTPRPRINLVLYHGVPAPHARWRALGVPHGAPLAGPASAGDLADESSDAQTAHVAPRHWAWARLMRRAFDIDVLVCPRCGGQLRLIATVEDPGAARAILTGLEFGVEASTRASPPVAASAAN